VNSTAAAFIQINLLQKMKLKLILKELFKGILPALPFGNVIQTISANIKEDGYTPTGAINWPKLTMYIVTGLIVLGRLLGVITNDDVVQLVDTLSQVN
tara:strand:+ start:224 stop:517 length:294 start_codon:yes stop_codon:yes gene_type:complete